MTIVQTLQSLRRSRGRSQEDVSAHLGRPGAGGVAYHMERSPLTSMTVRSLDRYAEALGGEVVLAFAIGDKVFVLSDPETQCQR